MSLDFLLKTWNYNIEKKNYLLVIAKFIRPNFGNYVAQTIERKRRGKKCPRTRLTNNRITLT